MYIMFGRGNERRIEEKEFEREKLSKELEKTRLEEIARLEDKIREHINTKD